MYFIVFTHTLFKNTRVCMYAFIYEYMNIFMRECLHLYFG